MTAPASPVIHRQRWTDITKNAGASAVARILAAVGGLAQVPFALSHLGPQAYGFWMTLTGIVTLLNISDLGLGIGLQNRMAADYGRGENAAIIGLFRYGLRQLLFTAMVAGPVSVLFILRTDWAGWLNLTDPRLVPVVRSCLFVTLVGFCLNLPLTLAGRLASAVQRAWLIPFWNCAAVLLQLAAIIALARLEAGVTAYVGVFLAGLIFQNLAILLHLKSLLPWLRGPGVPPAAADRHHLRLTAVKFFAQQACATFSTSFLPVAISIFSGPVMVTQFNLLQRLLGVLLQLQWMAAAPLWPAYTEALARRDGVWISRSFSASLWFMVSLSGVFVAVAFAHTWLLRFWLGPNTVAIDPTFLAISAVWFGGLLVSHPFAALLGGLGHAGGTATYWIATTVIFMAGTFWLGPAYGALAVVGSAAAAMAAVNVPGMVIEALVRYRRLMATLPR
jgi:O-antigen/teichoic acid export membrane protein